MVAEKNRVCRSVGSLATILRMSWMKPMSSMRSASSRTRTSTSLRRSALLRTRSSRRPGRRDQHVDAVHQGADLLAHRHAADGQRRVDAQVAAIGVEAVEDLARQFARRAEHQRAAGLAVRSLRIGEEVMQDRQREGGGLAGSGLRDADDVAAGQGDRNGLGLDGGGGDVFLFGKRTQDRFGEAEVIKRRQWIFFLWCERARLVWSAVPCRGSGGRHPA